MTRRPKGSDDLKRALAGLLPAGPCPTGESLLAFYEGALAEADAEEVREHVATCPSCLARARDARRFVAALRAPARGPARRATRIALLAAAAGLGGLALLALLPERRSPAPAALVWRGDDGSDAFDAALADFRAGRYAAAEEALESYVLVHPADDRARLVLAVSRLHVGRIADARRELLALTREGEESVRAEAERWLARIDGGEGP